MDTNKKRHHIYLAGNISHDPRTYQWREDFTDQMKDVSKEVVIINPCSNRYNQTMNKANHKDGIEFAKEAVKKSQHILRAKDYQLIKICSLIVVNLELFSPEKPMIGTVQELTWAKDIFYVPVIAITGRAEHIYTLHPWIDECCSAKVDTVEDAVEMVKDFFLEF